MGWVSRKTSTICSLHLLLFEFFHCVLKYYFFIAKNFNVGRKIIRCYIMTNNSEITRKVVYKRQVLVESPKFPKMMVVFFQLQFTFNIIIYQFQVCSIVVRQSCTLQSVPPPIFQVPAWPHTQLFQYYWL